MNYKLEKFFTNRANNPIIVCVCLSKEVTQLVSLSLGCIQWGSQEKLMKDTNSVSLFHGCFSGTYQDVGDTVNTQYRFN